MKLKATQGLLHTAVLLACCTGCSGLAHYVNNRASDLRQIPRLTIGLGLGLSAEAQAGPVRPTAGAAVYAELGTLYGRWKNTFVLAPCFDTNSNYGLAVLSQEGFQPVVPRRDGYHYRLYDLRLLGVRIQEDPLDAWSHHEKTWLRHTDVELGGTLGVVRASAGLSAGEIADFLLGWFGLDIAEDDAPPPETEADET
ncbi:MAG: hypothetical protein ACOC8E_08075 [Planctomycetota bacterium]